MNHTKTLTLILLTLLTAASGMATAQNRTEKRPRKLSTKKQLVIERQRADSLAALVEEYRRRESDWQKAWHDAQEQDERHHHVEQFAVDYTPARADSLAEQLRLQQVDDALQNFFNDYVCEPADMSTDTQLDSLYAARLKTLVSPIHLPYNQIVRTYIKRYTDGSGLMSRVLSLSQYYFPMIDEELLKAGLPVELHAMAIIESALSATAYSRAGAAGLWQFMPTTAKAYGLEVNSMVDERYDPLKSTRAACRYMKDLYEMYNDWSLAIAAYNCGPGNVNKAMARAGGNPQSFWDVYEFLPRETRGYVPSFIAASYAYAYHQAHNITYAEPPMPIAVDTIQVSRLLHLGQVSSTIDVSTDALKMLNPAPAQPAVQTRRHTSHDEELYARAARKPRHGVHLESGFDLRQGLGLPQGVSRSGRRREEEDRADRNILPRQERRHPRRHSPPQPCHHVAAHALERNQESQPPKHRPASQNRETLTARQA